MSQTGLFDRLADQRTARLDLHLDGVLARVGYRRQRRPPVGQKPMAAGHDQPHAGHRARHANPGDVEHSQPARHVRRHAGGLLRLVGAYQHTVYQQIGAGADQRAHAAENRGVAQGNHQFRRGDAVFFSPFVDGRNQHCDDRRVVYERAEYGRRRHQSPRRPAHRIGIAEKSLGQPGDCPGFNHAGRDDEEQPDSNHSLVGEAGQGVLGPKNAGQHEDHQTAAEHQIGRQPRGDEHRNDRRHHGQRQIGV